MPEAAETRAPAEATDEAVRVYQHFREVFGGAPTSRRKRREEPARGASAPFGAGREPRALGDTLNTLTVELGWSSPLAQQELLSSWSEVAGDETARHSEPVGLEHGVLTVRCDSTAWATQLRMMRTTIAARIVDRYPEAGVETIRFQGPDAPSWKKGPRSVPGRGPRDTYG
ncbi:hypothetical protein ARHIZOSPH14_14770 [Agromyces rhizosphaerae]|uniref:DUF721 domain-containing protein n=1 Tax=Agromyces rhizosphaerae TaxID=88374 RepID=A0A9W6CVP7_9MICO|nr:DciA family protein [Agromyces rhizosphaerae]GLI27235.1 hypothetical protein ARHIZOSPH14_14770 [Agromyces rhizosphaerae]